MPAKPSLAERAEHYASGQAAFRAWCAHCVKSRGRTAPHFSAPEGELSEVGVDYAYYGPTGRQVMLLGCEDKRTGCLAATQVPAKGVDCLLGCGHSGGSLVVRTPGVNGEFARRVGDLD